MIAASTILMIGFDVYRFLRQCLQEHLPIGSIVNVLESQLGNTYLHFDSLSQHTYEYSCTLCGYHPKILIMHLHLIVMFQIWNCLKITRWMMPTS